MPRATKTDALIGRNIRTLRALRGLGQLQVAEQMVTLGHTWTRQTVSDIERGRRAVLVSEVQGLATVLDVAMPKLLAEQLL